MAEILTGFVTDDTLYFIVANAAGNYWDDALNQFEAFDNGSLGDYDIPMTEDGTPNGVGIYRGTYPAHANMVNGTYDVIVMQQLTGAPLLGDIAISIGTYTWDGTTLRLASDMGAIDTDADSVTRFKRSIDAVQTGAVVADGANNATTFLTNLTTGNNNYYGDASGGLVIAFIQGTTNQYQTRRIIASETSVGNTLITLEAALDATPSGADAFVVLGRITELS